MARGGSNPPFRTNILPNSGMKSALQRRAEAAAALSGSFVAPDQLAKDIDDGRICEPWSVEIARRLLPEGELVEPRLV